MNRVRQAVTAALTCTAAFGSASADPVTIVNPTNSYSLGNLSGSLTGGNQTQYLGETFTAPVTGALTNFQFTLNSSNLQSLYGIVYVWNGSNPTTELWRSSVVPGSPGLVSFNPTSVSLTQGQIYVAFLSTFGLSNNAGLAAIGSCLNFVGCSANSVPNLGTLIVGNVLGNGPVFNPIVNNSQDATFSVTINGAAVPEPATWAMTILGIGAVGYALRRRSRAATRVRYAA